MARTTINSLGIPDDTIVSADLDYPLTDFSSTGIDDNATSTALTIDSSGNITVTGTVDGRDLATDGTKLDGIAASATNYGDSDVATYISGNRTYGNITTTGYIAGPSTFTIDPAAVGDNTGTLVIAGNLQVDGTTTTINSTTMTVDDLNITLASGAANAAAANGAGITVDGASATITYDATNDEWDFNKALNVSGNVGIGSAGNARLQVFGPSASPSLGTYNNSTAIISNNAGGYGMSFSIDGAGTGYIQSQNFTSSAAYNLSLNPAGGNVGIGTSSPESLLQVGLNNGGNNYITIGRSGLSEGGIQWSRSGNIDSRVFVDTAENLILSCDDTNLGVSNIIFRNGNSTERMRIGSSGNVGIGGAGNAKLEVFGPLASPSLGTYDNSAAIISNIAGGYGMSFSVDGTGTGYIQSQNFTTSTAYNLALQLAGGNVGIGTSSIDYQASNRTVVHVEGSAGALLAMEDTGAKSYLFQTGNDLLIENDTSTGSMIFGTNASTERMRIDSDGTVRINGAPSFANNLFSFKNSTNNNILFSSNPAFGGNAVIGTTDAGADAVLGLSGSNVQFYTSATERMRIDSSGVVKVGTSAQSGTMQLVGSSTGDEGGQLDLICTGSNGSYAIDAYQNRMRFLNSTSSGGFQWYTYNNGSIGMTFTGDGNLLVGTTTANGKLSVAGASFTQATWDTASAITTAGAYGGAISLIDGSNGYAMYCADSGNDFYIQGGATSGSVGGGVYLNNFATSWSSASDERDKVIVEPIENATEKLANLRTVIGRYTNEEEDKRHPFLIAQDVQKVLPEAVSVRNKEAPVEEQRLGIAYTEMIPVLVKAIQEQQAMIEELKAEVAALKGA